MGGGRGGSKGGGGGGAGKGSKGGGSKGGPPTPSPLRSMRINRCGGKVVSDLKTGG